MVTAHICLQEEPHERGDFPHYVSFPSLGLCRSQAWGGGIFTGIKRPHSLAQHDGAVKSMGLSSQGTNTPQPCFIMRRGINEESWGVGVRRSVTALSLENPVP